jgi:aryl-alcohol dehydrogenase-like predicted oxidoreductase
MPFGYGRLFPKVKNAPLPDWAEQFDSKSWAQFFLKYVVSHPAVTCAIPGMRRVPHLLDNIQAAQGRLPDAAMRRRMEQYFDNL